MFSTTNVSLTSPATDTEELARVANDKGLARVEPALWVNNRIKALRHEAYSMRIGINTAKSLGAGSAITGALVALLFEATGVGMVVSGLGLAGYSATVLCDWIDTGKFSLLPFMRTNLGDRLDMLDADMRVKRGMYEDMARQSGQANTSAQEELYSHLSPELANEAAMLNNHGVKVANLLVSTEPSQRDLAYAQLCFAHESHKEGISGISAQQLSDRVAGNNVENYGTLKPARWAAPALERDPRLDAAPALDVPVAIASMGESERASRRSRQQSSGRRRKQTQTQTQTQTQPHRSANIQSPAEPPAPAVERMTALKKLSSSYAQSLMIFGGQRTGKSYACAVSTLKMHNDHGIRIMYVNLDSHGVEDSYYWNHVKAKDKVVCNLSEMDGCDAQRYIDKCMGLVDELNTDKCRNTLLVFDEIAKTGGAFNAHIHLLDPLMQSLASVIETVASTGMKQGKAIWAIAPVMKAGSLTKAAAHAMKIPPPVLFAISPGHTAEWKDPLSGMTHELTFDSNLFGQVNRNFDNALPAAPRRFSESRLCCFRGEWMSNGVNGKELKAPQQ